MTLSNSHCNNDPIVHHYIPQFLLRRWMGLDKKIQRYKYEYGGKFVSDRVSPRGTAYEPLLYTPAIEDKVMKKVDDDAASVIDEIISQGLSSLTDSDRESMAKFIASLWLRHPAEVRRSNIVGKETLEILTKRSTEEYDEIRSDKDPLTPMEAINQYCGPEMGYFGLIASCDLIMGEQPEGKALIQNILGLEWELVNFEEIDTDLLLADNPCIRVDGIPNPDCSISVLPLSPKHVFLAAQERKTIDEMVGIEKLKLASYLNNSSVQQASKYVYAFNDRHRDLVEIKLIR
jgi:hypothetical protein